ncbi:MAG TPA: hypothetical protein VNN25_12635 [Thermoanaerobaculia bacterium]|nr:hypothetical protein [Thermoanaerobaculia bacterium]
MRYNDVYVSLRVPIDDSVASQQSAICEAFNLIPRKELHVTIGFLGTCEAEQIASFGAQLSAIAPSTLSTLRVLGVGGALQDESGKSLFIASGEVWQTRPRVLWWAVECPEALIGFRNGMIAAALGVGLNASYLRPQYTPHITLGSAGPPTGHDWSLFDVHDLPKDPTFRDLANPQTVSIDRLHVTSVERAPDSLFSVREY